MVLGQIETMYSSGTKISVSVLDLNVIKITTTRRHNFWSIRTLIKNNNPARLPICIYGKSITETSKRGSDGRITSKCHMHSPTDLVDGYLAVSTQLGWLDGCWGGSRGEFSQIP